METMTPGEAEALHVLSVVVDAVRVARRGVAGYQAVEAELLALAVTLIPDVPGGRDEHDSEFGVRAVAAEIGAGVRESDRTVQRKLSRAYELQSRFPATLAALAEGRIDNAHVSVVLECGAHLMDDGVRALFEERVLVVAERESAARLRAFARMEAERVQPRTIDERHRAAATGRGVFVRDLDDAMSELCAVLPSVLAHGIHDRLTTMATIIRDTEATAAHQPTGAVGDVAWTVGGTDGPAPALGAGASIDGSVARPDAAGDAERSLSEVRAEADPDDAEGVVVVRRTTDQIRADLFAELALAGTATGGHPDGLLDHVRGEVHVTVPVLTLLGPPATVRTKGVPRVAGTAHEDPDVDHAIARHAVDPVSLVGARGYTQRCTPDDHTPAHDLASASATITARSAGPSSPDAPPSLAPGLGSSAASPELRAVRAGQRAPDSAGQRAPDSARQQAPDSVAGRFADSVAGRFAVDVTPVMLNGTQPIDTTTARWLAGAVPGWDRVLTHPITGSVLAVDRYRPSAEQRRYLRAVDMRCRFPGCRMVPSRCDVDHVHDAALGGETRAENLSHLCRRHHVLKHHSRWTVIKTRDGTIEWTSPTGRVYPDNTPPGVHFTTDPPVF